MAASAVVARCDVRHAPPSTLSVDTGRTRGRSVRNPLGSNPVSLRGRRAAVLATGLTATLVLSACGGGGGSSSGGSGGASAAPSGDQPIVGLITKTDTNPFFVKMKEGATAE